MVIKNSDQLNCFYLFGVAVRYYIQFKGAPNRLTLAISIHHSLKKPPWLVDDLDGFG
jgi:hypothetical protein